ncbi:fimbria/pilus outer membrane usher protein [Serratia marcescens]|uniref:fimbria/pilus outer membrane usher protein n=1 Tax=Serratia marcescens TaxID=615 RepID=UPI0009755310|nr:fimbria/pilus outer membrane usher protein [Serratia marcescens]OMP56828.1 fimbrial assembly protein [Serratia marcescens]
MHQYGLNYKYITALSIFLLLSGRVSAVEFNTDILDTDDKKNIDFSRFSREGYILPGNYQMQVKLNGESLGSDITVPFYVRAGKSESNGGDNELPEACLSPLFLDKLGLTEEALKKVGTWHQGACADFNSLAGTKLKGDMGSNTLNINMPQAWLEYSDASWLPPSRWDNGIPGLLLDYNANGNVTKTRGNGQQQNAAISGTVGGNAGAWRLRADYQGSYTHATNRTGSTQQSFDFTRVYLYRPLPSLSSVLTLGENYVNSNLFDSWRYTGTSLSSDERMLPPKLRGYAPEIIGVAKTNARVTVTQQGRVVYDSTVPAGPFRIQDLDSAIRGQLDVKVTEQNGDVQTFSVSTASVPYLTRPGQVRYQLISGRPSTWKHRMEGPMFASGEASWGISNNWSLYGGSTLSDDYQAMALGVGRDLEQFGTVAVDVTQSLANLPGQDDRQGKSWRVSYSKHFDEANTDVTFAGYRFSERDYMSMQQYLDARYRGNDSNRQKERYQINLNKRFDELLLPLSLGLNYQYQTYWDQGNTSQYGVNAGTWFDVPSWNVRNVSLTLTATRSQYQGRDDDAVNLMVSVPLGTGTVSYNGSYGQDRYGQRIGYYDRVNDLDSYNVNAGLEQGSGRSARTQFNGMYTHNGALAVVNANAATAEGSYSSFGLSANGGLTVTGKGAALHAGGYNGSTRLVVDTDGVGGVPVDGGRVVTNPWGIGVLTNVNSYYRTTARVDVNKMADDVEATQGVVETALTDGAIGYRRFEVLKGERLFAVLRLADGTYPPFGSSVRDVKGRELGIVSDTGLVWLSGVAPNATLNIAWDGRDRCQVYVPMKLNSQQQLLLPCTTVGKP